MKDKNLILVFFLLLTGLVLRIYNLDKESIWVDEGISVFRANLDPTSLIINLIQNVHPPFYFLNLHYWVGIFRDSELSIRCLSVIFSFFAMGMIYRVGTEIFNKNIGLFSLLLLSISPLHIFYAQEARSYSLMTLLSLLSMYYFLKLLDRQSLKNSTGYVISSGLLIYTHNYGLFIILAQNIYMLTMPLFSKELKFYFKKWMFLQCLLFVLYLPWIRILSKQILKVQEGFWISPPTQNSLIKTFTDYSAHSPLLLLLFVLLAYFSFINIRHDKSKNIFRPRDDFNNWIDMQNLSKIYLLSLWIFVPVLAPFIISKFSTPIYHTRYTISASIPFYILAAKGIYNIGNRYVRHAVIILIVFLSLGGIKDYYSGINKPQWANAARLIERSVYPRDLLMFSPGDAIDTIFNYYSKRNDLLKIPFPPDTKWQNITEENIGELGKAIQEHRRVWFILSFNPERKKLILDKFKSLHYNLAGYWDYSGSGWKGLTPKNLDIYLFEKERP